MISEVQDTLFADTIRERFEKWKATPAGGRVMAQMYRIASGYFKRFQRRGVRTSQRLIEELTRDAIRCRELRGAHENGFSLNSHFTAQIVRHMIEEHPEWRAMFELRKVKAE